MTFIFSIFALILGFLPGLLLSSFSNAQSSATDVERQTDINELYTQLETHYNEYGGYPTLKEMTESYDIALPGLDIESMYDPDGAFLNEGDYRYEPTGCTAIDCESYVLTATLKDGSDFTKQSLN